MTDNNNLDLQFVACPVCHGTGESAKNKVCQECANLGLGVFLHNRFFYWKLKFNRKVVFFNRVKKSINLIFDSFLYLLAIGGFIYLAFYYLGGLGDDFSRELGAVQKHPAILIFWLGILALMFSFYRYAEKLESNKIKPVAKAILKQIPNNWRELRQANKKFKIDVADGFSPKGIRAIENSFLLAYKRKNSKVEIAHILKSLMRDKEAKIFLKRLGVKAETLSLKIDNQLALLPTDKKPAENVFIGNVAKKALIETYLRLYKREDEQVEPINFFLSFLKYDTHIEEIFYELEIDQEKVNNTIEWIRIDRRFKARKKRYSRLAIFKPSGSMDRAFTAVATPVLDHFSMDLTKKAKKSELDICIDREEEINNVFENFIGGRRGCLLIGDNGVGKSAIVEGIAQLMVEEQVPEIIRDKRLLRLDVARLISGAAGSEVQERLLVVVDEIKKAGNIILYIENLENITGIKAGDGQSLDLSEALAQSIRQGLLYLICSTVPSKYTSHIEGRPIGQAMANIEIKEPDKMKATRILESKASALESKYKIYFSYDALERAVYLSDKYMRNKRLPQKAIELINSVAVKAARSKEKKPVVTKEHVAEAVGGITGIPMSQIGADESKKLLNLETEIHKRMIGQVEAVSAVASSLRRARVELREGKRPISSFLFLGPTGVGKTELAKTVAQIYFGNEKNMIRLDMSEYQHADSVKKMIGSAGGTLGYLTEAVRKSPFSLILLDEIEKADPKIMDLFLQVMDDGRLTDGQGQTIDFTNTIIIATSNIGSVYIQEQISIGTAIEKIKNVLLNEHMNKIMRPEMINRFDGVIIFRPLTFSNIAKIAGLMLGKIEKLLEAKGISTRFSEDGVKELARLGFDPAYGARPLRRLLQEKVENPIASKILGGELRRRDTVVINKKGQVEVEKGRVL